MPNSYITRKRDKRLISAYLPKRFKEQLRALAQAEETTETAVLEKILREGLKERGYEV